MTKKTCSQCGNPLTKGGAKFCTICGVTVDGAETDSAMSMETRPLIEEQAVPANAATEVLQEKMASVSYETEEMPQTKITAQAEKIATTVVANPPVTQPQKKRQEAAPAKQSSGGRKGLLLAVAIGVVVLAAVLFFFVISREPSETQAENRPADKTEPSTATQPIAQPPNQQPPAVAANNQAQSQSSPAVDALKPPAVNYAQAASTPQKPAVTKPTPTTPQEKQAAVGASAETYKNQGITDLNAGRHQEALRAFESVKRLDPANKDVYYLIGQAYQRMNQLEQALNAYRQCTSGVYASVSQNAVKKLEKQVGKVSAK